MSTGYPETSSWGPRANATFGLILPAVIGLLACTVAIALSESLTNRRLVAFAGIVALGIFALKLGRVREACLMLWVCVLPYPRTYFLDSGEHGFHGPYCVVSDVLLAVLYVIWWFEVAVRKRATPAVAGPWWPWLLPFAIAALWSGSEANRSDWTVFEMLRIVRFGLILLYLRYNLTKSNLVLVVIALLIAVGAQSALGIVQVTTKRFGVSVLPGEEFVRSAGLLIHPNAFASYLLMCLPAVMVLAAGLQKRWHAQACCVVALLMVGALAGSMSRTAWVLMVIELSVTAVVLIGLRLVKPQVVIGLAAMALAAVSCMAIPLRDKIARRISGNLRESFDARGDLNQQAIKLWKRNPAHGIGMSNFEEELARIAPEWDQQIIFRGLMSERYVRMRVLVHNVWLLIVAETGWVGLVAFIWLLFGVLWRMLQLLRHRLATIRALGFGLAVGLLAVASQQFLEYTLWLDSSFLTVALLASIAAAVPTVLRE